MKLLLTTILLISQALLLIIPVVNKEPGKTQKKKKYNSFDLSLIFLSIIGLGISLYIFIAIQDEESEKTKIDNQYKQELAFKLAQRDSFHQIQDSIQTEIFTQKLDSSYLKSIKSSNEALAKYNFVLVDSLNKVSNRIQTESFRQPAFCLTAVENGKEPIFLEKQGDKNVLVMQFRSINNTSYNVRLKISLFKVTVFDNGDRVFELLEGSTSFGKRNVLVAGDIFSLAYPIKQEWLNVDNALIFITAIFDSQNKTSLRYEDGAYFDFTNNKSRGKINATYLDSLTKKFKEINLHF